MVNARIGVKNMKILKIIQKEYNFSSIDNTLSFVLTNFRQTNGMSDISFNASKFRLY
jgi:hypothetical protein